MEKPSKLKIEGMSSARVKTETDQDKFDKSLAYINAMKALQQRINSLESENNILQNENEMLKDIV